MAQQKEILSSAAKKMDRIRKDVSSKSSVLLSSVVVVMVLIVVMAVVVAVVIVMLIGTVDVKVVAIHCWWW